MKERRTTRAAAQNAGHRRDGESDHIGKGQRGVNVRSKIRQYIRSYCSMIYRSGFLARFRLVKPEPKRADREDDFYNAIFLGVALAEETRAFLLRAVHARSPELRFESALSTLALPLDVPQSNRLLAVAGHGVVGNGFVGA